MKIIYSNDEYEIFERPANDISRKDYGYKLHIANIWGVEFGDRHSAEKQAIKEVKKIKKS